MASLPASPAPPAPPTAAQAMRLSDGHSGLVRHMPPLSGPPTTTLHKRASMPYHSVAVAAAAAQQKDTVETEEVWENQRGQALFGRPRYSARSLLPTERRPWSDASGNFKLHKDKIQLPDPRQWEWISEWMVDMSGDVDAEGWQYAFNFGSSAWSSECTALSYVRRRRWKRLRRLTHSAPLTTTTTTTTTTNRTPSAVSALAQQTLANESSMDSSQQPQQQHGLGLASQWSHECKLIRVLRDTKLRSDLSRVDAVRKAVCAGSPCEGNSRAHLVAAVQETTKASEQLAQADEKQQPVLDDGTLATAGTHMGQYQHDSLQHEQHMVADLFGSHDAAHVEAKLHDLFGYLDFESTKVTLVRLLLDHMPRIMTPILQRHVAATFVFYSNKRQLVPHTADRRVDSAVEVVESSAS